MKLKHIIVASAMAIALPSAYAGEIKDDMSATGHDIKETATDTGHAIKQNTKDAALSTKVKTALAQEKDLSSLKIHVESAAGGVVTLTGMVKSSAQVDQAVAATKAVEGVTDVKNKLQVKM